MEIAGFTNFRYRSSSSPSPSDHFLGLFSLSGDHHKNNNDDTFFSDEFNESEILWSSSNSEDSTRSRKLGFRLPEKKNSGVLTVLSDDDVIGTTTTAFRSIPKPQRVSTTELTQSSPASRKFQNSAPINVPPAAMMMKHRKRLGQLDGVNVDYDDDVDDDDDEMLPPHEIVAMKLKTTSSVLEGVGRTLKGRDLRQVRNAVWRQTGFLD